MVEVIIGVGVVVMGGWGTIWYKLGKLTAEVKRHNEKLDRIEKAVNGLSKRSG